MENDNQPATKQDLADVRTEMKAMEERLIGAFRDSQTELRKAFVSFTESNRLRVSQLEGNQAALIARIGTLEDRLTELERSIISRPQVQ
jgi:cell division GTPase FtsZ